MSRFIMLIGASLFGLALSLTSTSLAQSGDPTARPQGPVVVPGQIQLPRTVAPQAAQQPPPGVSRAPQLNLPPAFQVHEQMIPVMIISIDGRGRLPAGVRDASLGISFPEPDHDGDGHRAAASGGGDCDDNDARRYPSNTEVADDLGHDEDCDFATVGVRDADGDGFISWRASNIAHGELGQPIAIVRGGDCDDSRADVNPTSPEVLGNLRDDNCDGLIDVFDSIGHTEYCAPTGQTGVTRPSGCGRPAGDTSQFSPVRR